MLYFHLSPDAAVDRWTGTRYLSAQGRQAVLDRAGRQMDLQAIPLHIQLAAFLIGLATLGLLAVVWAGEPRRRGPQG